MDKLSYRMLYIGTAPAGLLGLEELFNELFDAGITPKDGDIGDKLIKGVRKHNFVPNPAINDYLVVLKREYAKFHQGRKGRQSTVAKDYGQWRGYPREQIPWFPTISSELCDGCGACIQLCTNGVYEKDDNGKVIVVEPFLCIVECSSCISVCDPKAILFPPQQMLNDYRPK